MKKFSILFFFFLLLFSKESYSQYYIGEIKLFAGNFAPQDFMFCDGSLLSISQHIALYTLIGTTYGGDGVTTFALPNLKGRVPMHKGNGTGLTARISGQTTGQETITLTTANLPAHTHGTQLSVSNLRATTATPTTTSSISTSGIPSGRGFRPNMSYTTGTPSVLLQSPTTTSVGTASPINNLKPYLVLNYIIAISGVYPPQN